MSKFVHFCSLATGQFFIMVDTPYNPEDPRPHSVFLKVSHAAFQKGIRYPAERKIIMPRENTQHRTMYRDRTQVTLIEVPANYQLLRGN